MDKISKIRESIVFKKRTILNDIKFLKEILWEINYREDNGNKRTSDLLEKMGLGAEQWREIKAKIEQKVDDPIILRLRSKLEEVKRHGLSPRETKTLIESIITSKDIMIKELNWVLEQIDQISA